MKSAPTYGTRSRRTSSDTGVRATARTYGRARIGIYSEKAGGHITVDSNAERLVAHLLNLDPRVRSFRQQPFTVDLALQRVLSTREELVDARKMRGVRAGDVEYTPDFATVQVDGLQRAYEVKAEGYEGDSQYWAKVDRARQIMEAYGFPMFTVVVPRNERHPVLVNAQLLKAAAVNVYTYVTPELTARVEQYCDYRSVPMRTLCADLDISTGLIAPLLATGVLQADLKDNPICGDLQLSAAYGDLGHLQLIEELLR